jgi:hypothetical protein
MAFSGLGWSLVVCPQETLCPPPLRLRKRSYCDTAINTVVGSPISVSDRIWCVAVSPDRSLPYVTNEVSEPVTPCARSSPMMPEYSRPQPISGSRPPRRVRPSRTAHFVTVTDPYTTVGGCGQFRTRPLWYSGPVGRDHAADPLPRNAFRGCIGCRIWRQSVLRRRDRSGPDRPWMSSRQLWGLSA